MSGWSGLFPQWLGGSAGLASAAAGGMPAIGTETLTPAWQGFEAGATGGAAPAGASSDFMGGFKVGQGPWDPTQFTTPGAAGGGGDIAGALKGAAGAAGAGQQQQQRPQMAGGAMQSPIGQPRHAV